MPKRILVVDDDTLRCHAWSEVIQKEGKGDFDCEWVDNGQACLDRLKRQPKVDILLLDMKMPKPHGGDVIREILQKDPLPDIKIIPVTAYVGGWTEQFGIRDLKGMPAFKKLVQKPYDRLEADIQDFLEFLRGVANGG